MADPQADSPLGQRPVDRIIQPAVRFMHIEAASGVVLLLCAIVALVLANSPAADWYLGLWKTKVTIAIADFQFQHSVKHLINDGLMVVFFFVIGLEVKREIVLGELSDVQKAALPIAGALGGMLLPAGLFLLLQAGEPGQSGWGIPMATDIAFVVGCMAVLGKRVPHSLRVMLLSLAIADDVGAILVIAVGYTEQIYWNWLGLAGGILLLVLVLARIGVRSMPVYVAVGVVAWFGFHESGVHATVAGVILGLMTPARKYVAEGAFADLLGRAQRVFEGGHWEDASHRTEKVREFQLITRETISPLEYLENTLHPWVGFAIMPIFALANAGVPIQGDALVDPLALAVGLGLVVGKPLGILGCAWGAVRMGWARLPKGVDWPMILAGGSLAGIGFTMALFITELALPGELLDTAKVGVLTASAVSAALGMGLLAWTTAGKPQEGEKGRRGDGEV